MNRITFDSLGPAKVIELYSARENVRGFVVVDNVALGPAIGGVRVSPTLTLNEVYRLARTMTLKNSIALLPHGGAKAGIIADPSQPDQERRFRVFARMIRELTDYIPGPDLGCNERAMAWIQDEIGRSVGLPEELGGLPLDKLGATGYGVAECAEVAAPRAGLALEGARVALHGFGSVGKAAARFLAARGALIVAVADSRGAVYDPAGLDLGALAGAKERTGSVTGYDKGERLSSEALFGVDCDVMIPAATPDVIHEANADGIKARLVLPGANIATTERAEQMLYQRGVLVVPDFIANAGGVIMAAMEYARKTEQEAFAAISARIRKNTELILEQAARRKELPRQAAEALAQERVQRAMQYRNQ